MNWKTQINKDTGVWAGVVGYAQERMSDLTAVCTNAQSSDKDIRTAQAGILELERLLSAPQMIAAEAQVRSQGTARKEY